MDRGKAELFIALFNGLFLVILSHLASYATMLYFMSLYHINISKRRDLATRYFLLTIL